MKTNSINKNKYNAVLFFATVLTVAAVIVTLFFANRAVPFMMDDTWYGTDLRDGTPLSGFSDVIGSQIWHYLNWGGRSINHGLLQLTLMSGEMAADIINTLATVLLSFEMVIASRLISDIHGQKTAADTLASFGMMIGMLITCCPNFKMSMLWQAGCANYVYSSVWILAFYILYLRVLRLKKDLPLTALFIIPLGVITGWSTENMGPSAFVVALLITVYCVKKGLAQKRTLIWMIEGIVSSLAGSAICILAPGNFTRKEIGVEEMSLTLSDRLLQMLTGAGSYMFRALFILAVAFIIYRISKQHDPISVGILFLLIGALLSYGAMIMSPHYPDRAAFGTCMLIEVCAGALINAVFGRNTIQKNIITCLLSFASLSVILAVICL